MPYRAFNPEREDEHEREPEVPSKPSERALDLSGNACMREDDVVGVEFDPNELSELVQGHHARGPTAAEGVEHHAILGRTVYAPELGASPRRRNR